MRLVHWQPQLHRNPWANLSLMTQGMGKAFEDLFHDEMEGTPDWSPRVTITELENHYEVTAELPGMEKNDIKVELKDDRLTVSGEKTIRNEKSDRTIHLNERRYGSFARSFQVPGNIDPESIKAEFKNGVLTLELPKPEEEKPREIQISVK